MIRIYLAVLFAVVTFNAAGQVTLVEGKPVKFKDVVAAYKQSLDAENEIEEASGQIKEGNDYHFERWKWYWEQHLDGDGYIVPPAVNYIAALNRDRAQHKTTADQSDWKFQGPTTSASGYNGIGRINIIEFHPTNANTYWVGASGGGAWKTTDDGQTWTLMTGDLARLDVSDIDINPDNPNTMYLCTGDRDGGSATYNNNYSIGVLKSLDGGVTWNATGLSWNTSQYDLTNCLVISPNDTNRLILATNVGIQKSTNGGANWTVVQTGHYKQVLYHPTNPSIMYASRYDDNREIYRSTNGGDSWSVVTNFNDARRITLAVTPASPNLVRAAVCNNTNGLMGIYESTTSGSNGSFSLKYAPTGSSCNSSSSNYKDGDLITGNTNGRGCGKQGWYDLSMIINPTNANIMFFGAVNTYSSTNGGSSWVLNNQWTSGQPGVQVVHADKHWYAYHPLTGELFECNDGGIYKSVNPLSNIWTDITYGMGITQFYRNAVSNVSSLVLAGSQDNGTKGLENGTWTARNGGDGMDCQVDPIDPNVYYVSSQYGNLRRTTNGGNSYTNIRNNISGRPAGSWITPFIITPDNNKELIAGFKHIYYSDDRGDNWMSIQNSEVSSELCTRLAMTGGATPTIYAIFDGDAPVYYADNYVRGQHATFDTISVPYSGYISDIKAHPTDSGRFYLTFSAYNNTQVAEYNQGVWTKLNAGLPNIPVRCFEYDTVQNVMYVGTDIGAYYMDTSTNGQWASFNKGLPSIEVTDLGIDYTNKTIWAATYGRGLWSSVLQGSGVTPPDTTSSVVVIPYTDDMFHLAPNPSDGNFKIIATASVNTNNAITIDVVDYTGKTVLQKEAAFAGSKQAVVNASNLPAGVYIISLKDKSTVLSRKRIVIR